MGLFEKFGFGGGKVEAETETPKTLAEIMNEDDSINVPVERTPEEIAQIKAMEEAAKGEGPAVFEGTGKNIDQYTIGGVAHLQGNRDESMFKRVNRE